MLVLMHIYMSNLTGLRISLDSPGNLGTALTWCKTRKQLAVLPGRDFFSWGEAKEQRTSFHRLFFVRWTLGMDAAVAWAIDSFVLCQLWITGESFQ